MITASLVLFHNDPAIFGQAIASFLASSPEGELWVSDNSATPLSHPLFNHPRVHHVHNGANLGFGAGHNRAFARLPETSTLHLILNPDVRFAAHVLPALRAVMDADHSIGAVMPRINFPDGNLQRLAKLLPSPVDLILRRFVPSGAVRERINQRYELHDLPQDQAIEVPVISGCCLLVRTQALRRVGGFDERYFMYMEDFDLVRRLGDFSTILYMPTVNVVHDYAKGSYVNRKLLGYHMKSALKYFTKWGWVFDQQRRQRNAETLAYIAKVSVRSSRPEDDGSANTEGIVCKRKSAR